MSSIVSTSKTFHLSQGTVVLGVSVRFINRTLTWMRKVVGSNLDDDGLYRTRLFFFCGCGKYEIIEGDCYETVNRDC